MDTGSFLVAPGKVTMVEITAEKLSTSDGYRDLSVEDRGCYFEDEMPLQLFSEYTSDNCWVECLLNLTQKVLSLYDVRAISGLFCHKVTTMFRKHSVDFILEDPRLAKVLSHNCPIIAAPSRSGHKIGTTKIVNKMSTKRSI